MEIAEAIQRQTGLVHPADVLRRESGWMLQCPYCGAQLQASTRTCDGCGRELGGWALPVDDAYLASIEQIWEKRQRFNAAGTRDA